MIWYLGNLHTHLIFFPPWLAFMMYKMQVRSKPQSSLVKEQM